MGKLFNLLLRLNTEVMTVGSRGNSELKVGTHAASH